MRILSCEVWPVELTLEEPFVIAYSTMERAVNYFLRIDTDAGISGFGCSAFDEEVTGENERTVGTALREIAVPLLIGEDPLSYASILERLHHQIPDQPTAMASVDMALLDIVGKKAGLPLYKLLGGARHAIKSSITIGIQPVDAVVAKAVMWTDRGYRALKIKCGISVEEDIEKLHKVRERVGREVEIYVDANQGYDIQSALRFIRAVDSLGIEFIEQPCDKRKPDAFSVLRERSGGTVPLMADEAILGPEDVLRLIKAGGADLYNIKLAKTGGIWRARQLDAVAAAAGSATMVGCMDEAGLGIAAALHMALSSTNVRYADLDGHVEFIDDPSYDAVRIKDGFVYPNESPGLGFSFA